MEGTAIHQLQNIKIFHILAGKCDKSVNCNKSVNFDNFHLEKAIDLPQFHLCHLLGLMTVHFTPIQKLPFGRRVAEFT